jgi:hypothetical protein
MTSHPGASAPAGHMAEPARKVLRYMRKYDSSASFGVARACGVPVLEPLRGRADHRDAQRFLRREVVVQAGLAHPDGVGHVLEAEAQVGARFDEAARHRKDLLAGAAGGKRGGRCGGGVHLPTIR